jgi:hypothetical protein
MATHFVRNWKQYTTKKKVGERRKRGCVTRLHFCGSALLVLAGFVVASGLAVGCFAQAYIIPHEVRISDLPELTAKTTNASDVLATSVEIIFRDKKVCCGKDSALGDSVQAAHDPMSLKDIGDKLGGRHVLSDGRPIMVTAEYWPAATGNPNSSNPISEIMEKRALLMEWNSHLYVVYGVVYDTVYPPRGASGGNEILKFLLLDTRFSDERRKVSFNRQTDDWGKVQGLLMLKAVPQ